ncbi:MAG: DegV family protein [Clostridia bacterium]|nr:DegV family protein [Clostridia bacterium]
MRDYVILTDSSCDLPAELAEKMGIRVVPLSVLVDGTEYMNYLDGREIGFKAFYDKIREGCTATTSAVNIAAFKEAMKAIVNEGKDVLYIGFSSGLSATVGAGINAARELSEEYPGSKIYAVDTLGASLGQGMTVYYAAKKQQEGASIEEVRDFVEQRRLNQAHWFTVDDLNHLKRGGRISPTTAAIGTMLNIKPVMHMDNEGHLVAVGKVRGRKASLKELVNSMEASVLPGENPTIFISHGDCLEDAEYVASLVREKLGIDDIIINYVGPVIGAHTGPGVVALFFWASER